jgi:RNA polymerase sigma-70 factor (ECF subfamily)
MNRTGVPLPPDDSLEASRARTAPAAAFDLVYDRYKDHLFRLFCHLTGDRPEAEDLFQEAWLRVARNLPDDADPAALRPWLLTIALNLHRDALRKKRVRRLFFMSRPRGGARGSLTGEETAGGDDPAVRTEQAALRRRIDLAVGSLPDRQRRIFVLQEYEGLKQTEIAGILGIPVGTVKSLLHRAVRRLQKDLADCRPGLEKIKCAVKMLSV